MTADVGNDLIPSDDWGRIEALFDHASALPEGEREAFFAACAESSKVVAGVRGLLASDQMATEEGFLAPVLTPRPEVGTGAATREPPEPPRRFGAYRVIEEIGRGGMGVVYLAERDDGAFEQRVAIKVISGQAQKGAYERFARERQILADLNHPHIARLLDGGAGEDGEPYLVMEWIDGLPIDRYCAENELSTRQRLVLIGIVCGAVQAAHQRLVVHRDIKPSNVLVDRGGQVKLVDFGIATLLESSTEAESQAATFTGGRLMTPQYASPEQLLGRVAGVATDVYQLGLLAYELLSGRRPYELARVAPAEAMHLVLEKVPSSPSLAAQESPVDPRLDREIDALVSKALAKEPARRYASADQLREEIERYLAGLPIAARPPTFGYHLRKFISRHVLGVTLAVLAFVLMAGMTLVFTQRLIQERDEKRVEAERAERLRQESEAVVGFLVELFEVSDPNTARGDTITARELLDRGARDLEQELEEQPIVRARLKHTIATIFRRLGLYAPAEQLYREAGELRQSHRADPLDIAASFQGQALLLMRQGRLEESEKLLERIQPLLDPELEQHAPAIGEWLHHVGFLRDSQGRYAEAEKLLRRSLAIVENLEEKRAEIPEVLSLIGHLLSAQGRQDEALAYYERAIELQEASLDPANPSLAKSLNGLAVQYADRGQLDLALPLFERIHAILDAAYGADHIETLSAWQNLAIMRMELGDLDAAEAAFETVATKLEAAYGRAAPSLAKVNNNRANLARRRGQNARAEALYRRAIEVFEAKFGLDHPETASGLNNLGEVLVLEGRVREAEAIFRRALEIYEKSLADGHILASWPLLSLARLVDQAGDQALAGDLYRRAATIRQSLAEDSEERLEAEQAWLDFQRRQESGAGS